MHDPVILYAAATDIPRVRASYEYCRGAVGGRRFVPNAHWPDGNGRAATTFVTGAAGFIGSELVKVLVARRHRVLSSPISGSLSTTSVRSRTTG